MILHENVLPKGTVLEVTFDEIDARSWSAVTAIRVIFATGEGDLIASFDFPPERTVACSTSDIPIGSYDLKVHLTGTDLRFVEPVFVGLPDINQRIDMFAKALSERQTASNSHGSQRQIHLKRAVAIYRDLGLDDLASEVSQESFPFDLAQTLKAAVVGGTGRRKRATVRAWLRMGTGSITVATQRARTDVSKYFSGPGELYTVLAPLVAAGLDESMDVLLNCRGGGKKGQAEAARRAISVALVDVHPELKSPLKARGFLTSDARKHERKKYGQKGARKKFQFSKR